MKKLRFVLGVMLVACLFVLNACGGGGSGGGSGGNPSSTPTPANAITSFSINGSTAVITGTNIAIAMPFGTDVTALTVTFNTAPGYVMFVGNTPQISGVTVNNFTNPVTYRAVSVAGSSNLSLKNAAAASTLEYTVVVTVSLSSDKSITSYSLKTSNGLYSAVGMINGTNISVVMPYGTPDTTSLVATFATTGASVTVGSTPQQSGITQNNFTTPLSYIVTAFDGSTTTYTVTVTIAIPSDKSITSYSLKTGDNLYSATGIINGTNISVVMPYGTPSVTSLIATFITTGLSVKVGGIPQQSGVTGNNFTNPVTYVVTAADGSTQNYTVTVTLAGSPDKAITTFSINGYNGTINGLNIAVKIQFGTSLINLIPVFTTTGANVSVNGIIQVSNSSSQNFTSPVAYVVTAADGSTNTYMVSVDNTSNVWTWMSGSSTPNESGVYGTIKITSPNNMPGNRSAANTWTDNSGNLWFFGGIGSIDTDQSGFPGYSDLWKYNIATGYWTWMSGPDTARQPGTYGTRGIPDPANIPSSRYSSMSWTDNSGNLWLFGGQEDTPTSYGRINDLWKYNISTGYWTWMSGSNSGPQSGVYNTLGVSNPTSVPGGRTSGVTWVDASGKLWLFGGYGVDSAGTTNYLNDLWKFDPALGLYGEWTWMGGAKLINQNGTYGTQGTPSTSNIPGARQQSISWTDASGNFWLFGGYGLPATGNTGGGLNDLWKYNPTDGTWTWVSGPNIRGGAATYGTKGTGATTNIPGSRQGSSSWIDGAGNLWLFGGFGKTASVTLVYLNDLWKFNPTTLEWTWVSGDSSGNMLGVYGTINVPDASNVPGAQYRSMSWIDSNQNLWLFGGEAGGFNYQGTLWKYKP